VLERLVHRQPLGGRLFAGDDDIDVVPATQAVIGNGQQAIGVRWQIDPNDLGLFIDDVVDEPGVLMAEAVVVLAPDVTGQQVIQRANGPPPRNVIADLQPFGMLVEHRIDDVDEGLVAGEEAVAAGQEIPFQPTLALVLAQHLHDPPVGRQMIVPWLGVRDPSTVGDLEYILPAI
jgi:hypothetical protein